MATATKKAHATRPIARGARDAASLAFLVYRDNGENFRWEIRGGGESLAQSGSFASHEDALRAAHRVCDGAGSARFAPFVADERRP